MLYNSVLDGYARGESTAPRRGKRQAYYLFHYLLGLQASGTVELGRTFKRYAQGARNIGALLLISDLFYPTWQDGLRALLARRFDVRSDALGKISSPI